MTELTTVLLILTAIVSRVNALDRFKRGKTIIVLEKFGVTCPGMEKSLIGFFQNVKITKGENVNVDYDINITKPFPNQLMSTWQLEKCAKKESPDTCLQLQTMKTSQFCRMMASSEALVSFYGCTKPAWHCPYKKMVYVGKNCTYDGNDFNVFPLGNNYWRFKTSVIDAKTKEVLMCFLTEGSSIVKY